MISDSDGSLIPNIMANIHEITEFQLPSMKSYRPKKRKEWPLWASCLIGAGLAIIFAAFLLIAHLEYVEMTTKQVFCWDFSEGVLWIDQACNEALAYE